jgi:hypothetical protein
MKTNNFSILVRYLSSLAIAMSLVLPARAQNDGTTPENFEGRDNHSLINSLFAPTAAQRFFEAGRKDFLREIDLLTHPKERLNDNILKINRELRKLISESNSLDHLEDK